TELGLQTVAVYAEDDADSPHVHAADEAIGLPGAGPPAYLDHAEILSAAKKSGAALIHPGYGFLSENAAFARACRAAGLTFVGPRPEVLEQLGDKVAARRIAQQAGVPVLSGSDQPVRDNAEGRALAARLGYPIIVKASMGGGGRGMRVALTPDKLDEALDQARREAASAFGNADVFLERYIQ